MSFAHHNLPPVLPVRPFTATVDGAVELPGSKSITNRLMLIASLCREPVTLTGALFSRDTLLMIKALRDVGLQVDADPAARRIHIAGNARAPFLPAHEAAIGVGNAGTAARFLAARLALSTGGRYAMDGDEAMRARPMRGLLDALEAQGSEFAFTGAPGHFPFALDAGGLRGGELKVDAAASSQILSALLMCAPFARAPLTLHAPGIRPAYIRITVELMRAFGARVDADEHSGCYAVAQTGAYLPPAPTFAVEPDASAASYFIALPRVTGGTLLIRGLSESMLQGDTAFIGVMRALGLETAFAADGCTVRYNDGVFAPLDIDFRHFSDTFLTLAAIAPLLDSPTRIRGIAHTRHQETDRVAAMATETRKLGATVIETDDSLTIQPNRAELMKRAAEGIRIHTYEDHRIAMSFAIAGCHDLLGNGKPWISIEDPACCGKTFPDFFQTLDSLHS